MTPIEFLILCFLIQVFFWNIGKEYKLHNEPLYAISLLALLILSTIVLLSTIKGML